jgi:hypothetical protein
MINAIKFLGQSPALNESPASGVFDYCILLILSMANRNCTDESAAGNADDDP